MTVSDSAPARGSTTKGAQTRNRILDATVELLYQQGLDAVTFRSVASRANVQFTAVPYYFSSAEQLLQLAVEELTQRELQAVRQRLATAEVPITRTEFIEISLEAILGAAQPDVEDDEALIMVRYERLIATRRRPELQEIMLRLHDEFFELLTQAAGAADLDLSADEIRSVVRFVDGTAIGSLMSASPSSRALAHAGLEKILLALPELILPVMNGEVRSKARRGTKVSKKRDSKRR